MIAAAARGLVLPLRAGENTRRLVVEEGGFEYDSDYYGDELPFWLNVDGKGHLVVPYSLTTNDGSTWRASATPISGSRC